MSSSNFSCENCGSGDSTLHVHHKAYRRSAEPWDYSPAELACLCEKCHEQEHKEKEMFEHWVRIAPSSRYGLFTSILKVESVGVSIDSFEVKSYDDISAISFMLGLDSALIEDYYFHRELSSDESTMIYSLSDAEQIEMLYHPSYSDCPINKYYNKA